MSYISSKKSTAWFLCSTIFCIGCTTEEEATLQDSSDAIPAINSYFPTDPAKLAKISDVDLVKNQSVSAIYEGYTFLEFVYIPSEAKDSSFHVYVFSDDNLTDTKYSITKDGDDMVVNMNGNSIRYEIEDDIVVSVSAVDNYTSMSARTQACSASSIAGDFLDCASAVVNQARAAFGDIGALAFDVGCGLWVVCRGAFVTVCVAYGIVPCIYDPLRHDLDQGKILGSPSYRASGANVYVPDWWVL